VTVVARTSASHPLRVDWLLVPWPGRVGLTFAPGKKQLRPASGQPWDRELAADVQALVSEYETDHLVCLLEDEELPVLHIAGLEATVRQAGIAFHRLRVADGDVPRDPVAFGRLVSDICGWSAAGEIVVIHCKGGLGRAGTVGGCVLRVAGSNGDQALSALHTARGPSCPETSAQEAYIRAFAGGPPSSRSAVLGTVLGAAIGDAMGHPTEFLSMEAIRQTYGPTGVQSFELWWDRDGKRFAPYTDDTQLAEVVLRVLIDGRRHEAGLDDVMRKMAAGFAEWSVNPQGGHRAPGNACLRGAGRIERGVAWNESGGVEDGGCGSVMRAYPFGLVFQDDLERAEAWAVEHSKITHRHPIALAACAAMAVGTALALAQEPPMRVFAECAVLDGHYRPSFVGRCTSVAPLARRSQALRADLLSAPNRSVHVVDGRPVMAELDEQIATYLRAIEVEGKTRATQQSYANTLADFRRVGRTLGLPDRSHEYAVADVYRFLSALRERRASPAFQHRRHREVKACFSWLKRMGFVDDNVFARVPLVKRPSLLKAPFSPADVEHLLAVQDGATHSGARNRALILFLLDSGVRASECVALDYADIDWERQRAFVRHGKGEKQRWVGFGPTTAAALRDYVGSFRGDVPGPFFLTGNFRPMVSPHALCVIFERMGKHAGVVGVHAHRFRHSFATWAIESGAREIDVQMLLGHSDMTMTQRYARTYTSEQAVRAHGALSPVSRLAGS
jgi:ADP-ribosyl-[dinitrogen reductase] hydrolase